MGIVVQKAIQPIAKVTAMVTATVTDPPTANSTTMLSRHACQNRNLCHGKPADLLQTQKKLANVSDPLFVQKSLVPMFPKGRFRENCKENLPRTHNQVCLYLSPFHMSARSKLNLAKKAYTYYKTTFQFITANLKVYDKLASRIWIKKNP